MCKLIELISCTRTRPILSTDLFDVEKDERYFTVPKIVVECVKFIEQYDNVTKRYLYQEVAQRDYTKERKILQCQVRQCN